MRGCEAWVDSVTYISNQTRSVSSPSTECKILADRHSTTLKILTGRTRRFFSVVSDLTIGVASFGNFRYIIRQLHPPKAKGRKPAS